MEECMICSSGTGSGTEEPHWMRWKISTDLYISVTATRIGYLRGKFKIFSTNNLLNGNLYFPSPLIILLFNNGCCAKILKILYPFFCPVAINCLFIYFWYVDKTPNCFLILLSLLAVLHFIYMIIYVMSQNILIFYNLPPFDFTA